MEATDIIGHMVAFKPSSIPYREGLRRGRVMRLATVAAHYDEMLKRGIAPAEGKARISPELLACTLPVICVMPTQTFPWHGIEFAVPFDDFEIAAEWEPAQN